MNPIIRRNQSLPAQNKETPWLPEQIHRTEGLTVRSNVALGVEPRLRLTWSAANNLWEDGFKLWAFRNTTGFATREDPDDLNEHGQLFIETKDPGVHEEVPSEGSHFFTFLLRRKRRLFEKLSLPVRFSITIPSAKIGIGRTKDQVALEAMLQQHELGKIEHEAKMNEAQVRLIKSMRKLQETEQPTPPPVDKPAVSQAESLISEELNSVDTIIAAAVAERDKAKALKKDPKFRALPRAKREEILEALEQKLNTGEISARLEMREGRG